MKTILQNILAVLARLTIGRFKPMVIGITGSVGKTSVKEAVFAVLKKKYLVRRSEKNYNNEVGLPLTILGIPHHGKNIFLWCLAFCRTLGELLLPRASYPEILVLEYGVDKPGDMDYLLSIVRPSIAVVTALSDIPVHVEFFKDPEEVFREKAKLVSSLPQSGRAILNHDDYAVYSMGEKTRAGILTFGFEEHADVIISNYELRLRPDATREGPIPEGISFKIEYKGSVVPFRLRETFGRPQALSAAAATAVGIAMNMNLVEIAEAMRDYRTPPGRLRLLEGIKHTYILDDTYNASPEAVRSALDTLKSLPGRRKIAVLGDMLELGTYTEAAHRAIGDEASGFVDFLFTVGARAKFIAEEATGRGIEKNARVLSRAQVLSFDNAQEAGRSLEPLLRSGDLVLVKGSQGMRMEKAVEEIMANPERASELLTRQDEYWKEPS